MVAALLVSIAMAAAQAAPPTQRSAPLSPISWSCDMISPDGERFRLGGSIAEVPLNPPIGFSIEARIEDDGTGLYRGVHGSSYRGSASLYARWYSINVRKPDREHYHVSLYLRSDGGRGMAYIGHQVLNREPAVDEYVAVGFCTARVATSPQAGVSR